MTPVIFRFSDNTIINLSFVYGWKNVAITANIS